MSKLNYIFYLTIALILFISCKKKYSCECDVYVHYYYGISPPVESKVNYHYVSTIDEKMTHKKAVNACKDIETLYVKSITPEGSPYSVEEVTGGCKLK